MRSARLATVLGFELTSTAADRVQQFPDPRGLPLHSRIRLGELLPPGLSFPLIQRSLDSRGAGECRRGNISNARASPTSPRSVPTCSHGVIRT